MSSDALKPGLWVLRRTDFTNKELLCCIVCVNDAVSEMLLAVPKTSVYYHTTSWNEFLGRHPFTRREYYLPSVIKQQFVPYYASIDYFLHSIVNYCY